MTFGVANHFLLFCSVRAQILICNIRAIPFSLGAACAVELDYEIIGIGSNLLSDLNSQILSWLLSFSHFVLLYSYTFFNFTYICIIIKSQILFQGYTDPFNFGWSIKAMGFWQRVSSVIWRNFREWLEKKRASLKNFRPSKTLEIWKNFSKCRGGLLWLKLSKNAVEMVECQIHPSKSSEFKRKSNFEFHDIILMWRFGSQFVSNWIC